MSLETDENWPGFSTAESLQWARALLRHSLFRSLESIDADSFRWHPKNRQTTNRACAPGIPFETGLWKRWPQLILDDGLAPGTTAELVLTFADVTYRS